MSWHKIIAINKRDDSLDKVFLKMGNEKSHALYSGFHWPGEGCGGCVLEGFLREGRSHMPASRLCKCSVSWVAESTYSWLRRVCSAQVTHMQMVVLGVLREQKSLSETQRALLRIFQTAQQSRLLGERFCIKWIMTHQRKIIIGDIYLLCSWKIHHL